MLPSDGLCLNASKTASSPLNITISRVHTLVIHPWQVYASIHEYGLIGCRWCQRSTLPSPVNTTHAGRVHQTVCKRLSLWVGVLYSCEQLNTASGWDSSLDLKVCSLWRTLSFRSLFYKYFLLENPCGSLIFFQSPCDISFFVSLLQFLHFTLNFPLPTFVQVHFKAS